MIKFIFTFFLSAFISSGFSQINMSPNILAEPFQGQHFKMKSDNDVEGNPLLFSEWKSGEVILKNGENYYLQKMNLDASTGKFIYTKNDTIYEFFNTINEIKIYTENHLLDSATDLIFRSDLLPEKQVFVQVLAKGKVTILRKFTKKPEGENYSNGIVNNTRKYVLHTQEIAVVDNKVIPIKYSSSTLEELVSDKKMLVNSYNKSNNLKPKRENDFLKSINYYNSISTTSN